MDRWTTCDLKTALCTIVHCAVKIQNNSTRLGTSKMLMNSTSYVVKSKLRKFTIIDVKTT